MDLVILVGALVAACAVTYVVCRWAFRNAVEQLTRDSEHEIRLLRDAVRSLEAKVAETAKAQTAAAVSAAKGLEVAKVEPTTATAIAAPPAEPISPELLVVMAAAVTAFLGKKVRVRSARMLQTPYEIVNPWSQEGRIFVQASHNLRPRG